MSSRLKACYEFATDRAATEHNNAFGFSLELIENRFVREIRHRLDAFDFWNGGAASGGDYKMFRVDLLSIDFDFTRRKKPYFVSKNINTQ